MAVQDTRKYNQNTLYFNPYNNCEKQLQNNHFNFPHLTNEKKSTNRSFNARKTWMTQLF